MILSPGADTLPLRRIVVAMNPHADPRQAEVRRAALAEAFDRHGATASFVDVTDAGALRAVLEGRQADCDALVAAGGDGTIHTVANALARAAAQAPRTGVPPMGIVASGTFNYVARRYGVDGTLDEAARTVVSGRSIDIPAGEVSGHLFLNHCSLGLYTSIIDARERHKATFGRHRWVALLSGLATLLGSHARPRLRIRHDDGRERRLRASMVFVGANPLQLTELDPALAQRVADGALALVVVRAIDLRRLAGFAWRALTGSTVVDAPEIEAEAVRTATIVLRRRRLARIVLDGELRDLPPQLDLRWHERALRLRVPAPGGGTDGAGTSAPAVPLPDVPPA